jgi:hypothetical protein
MIAEMHITNLCFISFKLGYLFNNSYPEFSVGKCSFSATIGEPLDLGCHATQHDNIRHKIISHRRNKKGRTKAQYMFAGFIRNFQLFIESAELRLSYNCQ